MTTIYVLKLENEKYYVGKTDNLENRLKIHFSNRGSAWTKSHRPVSLYESFQSNEVYAEDNHTVKMMTMFGVENVRGGTYCQVDLSPDVIKQLRRQIATANDACLRCFCVGHFLNNCRAKRDMYGDALDEPPNREKDTSAPLPPPVLSPQQKRDQDAAVCFRCGRDTHWEEDCYASTHVDARRLPDERRFPSPQKRKQTKQETDVCFRCGRDTHWEEDCYASTHVDGGRLSSNSSDDDSYNFHQKRQKKAAAPPVLFNNSSSAHRSSTNSRSRDNSGHAGNTVKCSRCGRDTHTKASCYASVHVKGYDLYC